MDYHGTETDIHPIRKRITSQDKNHIELNLKTYKRLYRNMYIVDAMTAYWTKCVIENT